MYRAWQNPPLQLGLAQSKSIVSYNTIPPIEEHFISRGRGEYYLFFGRLSYEKGIKTLIEAFTALNGPKLKIVGTGPEEEMLKAYVAEHHSEDKIEFVGYRSGDELKELIRDASFVIVPSECYENNPMTIIEAYSAGVPVIGAHIGGIPEIIDENHTGLLFPSGDVQGLKEAITKAESLSEEEYAEMSGAARKFAAENFSEEQSYKRIITLYQEIIKQ